MKSASAKATTHIDVEIGSRIRELRKLRGMSQSELAQALPAKLTFQQIQKYENGKNRVSASALIEICKILQCHPNDIIGSYFEGTETTVNTDMMQRMQKYENAIRDIQVVLNKV